MSRHRKVRFEPGTIRKRQGVSEIVDPDGHWEPAPEPAPYALPAEEDLRAPPQPDFSHLSGITRRGDMTVHPRHRLTVEEMEHLGEATWRRQARHDGWTAERRRGFVETLAATASISEAARYVGLSRQSAHKLYRRDPHFRAAWDEAMIAATTVLAATAFDRAVNGYEEEVWHNGKVVGTRTRHSDRLLPYLLRVCDPMRFAPIDELDRWQRHRGPRGAIEARGDGVDRALDRMEAADRTAIAGPAAPPHAETAHAETPQAETPQEGARNVYTPSNPPAPDAHARNAPDGADPIENEQEYGEDIDDDPAL